MKYELTIVQALEIAAGLMGCDADPKDATKAFKFSGNMRMKLGKNLAALRSVLQVYETQRNAIMIAPGPEKPTADHDKAIAREVIELQQTVHTFNLDPLREAELQLDKNAIAVTHLAALAPLMAADDK